MLYSSWSFTKLDCDTTDLLFSALSRLSTNRLLLFCLYSLSLPAFRFTFIFFILQVKTCRLEPFWLALSSPLALLLPIEFWFKCAGPPKIDKNFFNEFDLTVSTYRASEAQRLEWCASLPLGILADCWYRDVFWSSSISDRECILDCCKGCDGCGCAYLKIWVGLRLFYFPSLFFFITLYCFKYSFK